jgi:hypothetical protein
MTQWYLFLERMAGHGSRVLAFIHIVSIVVCSALGCGSYWLVNRPNDAATAAIELPLAIEEAERLVASAVMWRDELSNQAALKEQLLAEAVKVTSWVPDKIDWRKSIGAVQDLAEGCDLVLVEVRPGEEFEGPRVAIHAAVCQLEGSYESICKFLYGLTKMEYPIWASELTMQRDSDRGPLTVVVHLRVPAAGKRSASAFLKESLCLESRRSQEPKTALGDAVAVTTEGRRHGY